MRRLFALWIALLAIAPLFAQSPNNASLIVNVLDQSGAVMPGATVSVLNDATGATREAVSGSDGSATIPALPLTGNYTVIVSKEGFGTEQRNDITLRSGETATLKVTLLVGSEAAGVTVYGTAEGVRADAQIGRRFDSQQIDETPILGRKITTLPLFNAAFRQAKGTGDLFVNATYFVTGAGSRRTTTYTLDGANNDEGWGRQTMIAAVPLGAVQEVTVLSNAFSSEYGWTAGPAVNVVTKSGTNNLSGEALYMVRPGDWQADTFSTKGFCPPSVDTCTTPSTLEHISPVDIPDELTQYSASIGGPLIHDKTFFFATADYTRQDRTTFLSTSLPAFVLPADGDLSYTGHYRQTLFNGRLDHTLTPANTLMFRANFDRMYDDNPQDAVGGNNAPSVARRYTRKAWTAQVNETAVLSGYLLNEARFAFLNGDPVTQWEAQTLSTTYTRGGSVPFTIGQSRAADLYGRQFQLADTLSYSHGNHSMRFGASAIRHTSGGFGSEPGTAILGTFTFKNATTAPFGQLTLDDVQQYTQPINFGIDSYELTQYLYTGFVQDSIHWRNLTVDLGLRYDRQTLTDDTNNFAPRLGFGWHPGGDPRLAIRGGYGLYYTQIRSNAVAGYLVNGLDGLATYTATSKELGFPTCLTGSCLPVPVDPHTLAASQIPARDITIRAGRADFYREQFARYGLNFDLLPYYPDELVNPRSEVMSIGAEREFFKGFFVGADFVHQHWTDLDRTVDLNAPSAYDRTSPQDPVRAPVDANKTRPIIPAPSGVRQVNVLMNLGEADYSGLQTQISYRGHSRFYAALSYTLSKATNTFEPDGNGVGSNQGIITRLGEEERGPSVLDQRHRAVLTLTYALPFNITVGTVTQYASARPFNALTGSDNNGDGINNDRPVIDGEVIGKSAFRGTPTSEVAAFIEGRIFQSSAGAVVLRLEGFNLLNHGNYLGRGQQTYGNGTTPSATFGQLVNANNTATALPAFANVDPPRMFQAQVRFTF